MGDYKTSYNQLNTAEKFVFAANPFVVGRVHDNANKALAEARKRFPAASLHNGEGDAFRHCYWSALMTRDIGFLNTKTITDAHENFEGNPDDEKTMDLHNNLQGIMIGLGNKRASDKELGDLCEKALRAGRLKVINR